ncbi:MAG: CCA tRNA nucleotidyltransferase [Chloroflexi bacterium]|nr:MAG: CCA tRNA nucleotidyltransferase [Chloroflexota bacterium]
MSASKSKTSLFSAMVLTSMRSFAICRSSVLSIWSRCPKMFDVAPREPIRPLYWPDIVLDLHDLLAAEWTGVYIVGGAVRDAFLHRPLKDLDLTVAKDSLSLARFIVNHFDGDFYVLDEQRQVARVLLPTDEGRFTIDIAQFRGVNLLDDLMDRDFTVNAMAVDITGELNLLIDPLHGEKDAIDKIIRRCTVDSISSDPIRALRAVRQSIQLDARIDSETMGDIRAVNLAAVSAERIRDELMAILKQNRSAAALRIAFKLGLLKEIFPQLDALDDMVISESGGRSRWQLTLDVIENLAQISLAISPHRTDHTAASFGLGMMVMQFDRYRAQLQQHFATTWPDERPHQSILVLAVILHAISVLPGKDARTVVQDYMIGLRLSNVEKQHLLKIVSNFERLQQIDDLSTLGIYQFWKDVGAAGVDICLIGLAEYLSYHRLEFDQDVWLQLVDKANTLLDAYFLHYETCIMPPALLSGDDIMNAFGLKPGAMIGELLEVIRRGQVTGDVLSVDDALRLVEDYLADHNLN